MDKTQIMKEASLIGQEDSFFDAINKMVSEQTNSLLVVDEEGILVGEISVTDLLDAIVPEYLDGDSIAAHFASEEMFEEAIQDTREKEVRYFMDNNVVSVQEDEGMMAIAAAAIAGQKARIPVVDASGRPLGIISRRGLKHIIAHSLGIKE